MQVVHVEARAGGEEGGRVDKRSITHCVAVEWFGWSAMVDASRFFKTEFTYCCNGTKEAPESNMDEQQPLAEIIATNPENLTNDSDTATVFPETSDANENARSSYGRGVAQVAHGRRSEDGWVLHRSSHARNKG